MAKTKTHVARAVFAAIYGLGASVLAGSPSAIAAETGNPSGAQSRQEGTTLEEIIVHAQKRSENLQSVPLAVSAVNAELIERSHSRDLLDLGSIAPNMIVDPILGNGTAAISIRGMQLNDVEKSFDPAVAVYSDGVYLATTTGALLNVFDAETVEVLRGPQGTLFGRNTIGGLVNVRRARPTGDLGGKLLMSTGSFDAVDIKGVLNLPSFAGDTLSAKFTGVSLKGGGYFDNVTRDRREGFNDFKMGSASLLFQPSDMAEFQLTYDYIDDKTPTRPVTALAQSGELFCSAVVGFIGCGEPPGDASYHRHPRTSLKQSASLRTNALTLQGTYDLSSDHQLATIIGWRETDETAIQEFDGVAAMLFNTERPTRSEQFSAELRYQGNFDRSKLVTGVYYWDSDYSLDQRTYFFGGEVPGGLHDQTAKNYAVFGQWDWDFVDNWTVSLGGRYTHEEKNACGGTALGPVSNQVVLTTFGDCPDATRTAVGPGGVPTYAAGYTDPATGDFVTVTGDSSWSRFTPRVALTYSFDRGITYLQYSEGFRSGGFNGRSTSANSLGPYEPEKVKSFELGLKSQWFDDRFQMNLAAFAAVYEDKQEDVVFSDPVAVTVTVVQNAAKAKINGLEAEFKAVPLEGLTLGANIGILDAKYDEYMDLGFNLSGVGPELIPIDKKDFELRRAPKLTANIDVNYRFPAGPGEVGLNMGYDWKDDYYVVANTMTFQNPNPGLIKSHGLLNASIDYALERVKVSVYGKNLTNTDYFQHMLDAGTGFGAMPGSTTPIPQPGLFTFGTINAPRSFGVELQLSF